MSASPNRTDDAAGYFATRHARTLELPTDLGAVAPYPINALVELTNGCNHACVFCKNANQGRRATFLPLAKFDRFVNQAVRLGLEEVGLYSTGEPFMIRNLDAYIAAAKEAGVRRVYLTTNGALATLDRVVECHAAGLDSIKYSINAANAADYALVHGFDDFDKVLRNVHDVLEWKRQTGAALQMLASCVMIPAVGDIREAHTVRFGEVFDDIVYVEANSQGGQAFDLIDEIAVSPHGVFGDIGRPNAPESITPCAMVWNRYHLTAEGYLSACCVDYELDLVLADLAENSLEDSWNNARAQRLREAHVDGRLEGLLCHTCKLNERRPHAPLSVVSKSVKSDNIRLREREGLKERLVVSLKLVD